MTSLLGGKNILITGGLGFIGSNVAIRLIHAGANVTVVDNLHPEYGGNPANLAGFEDKLDIRLGDIRDTQLMSELLRNKQYLINLAAQTSHMGSMRDPFTDLDINVRAQIGILEICREHNPSIKIVCTSTRQLYGRPDYLPVDESHPVRPVDANGINKAAGDQFHLLYYNVYGIRSCVLRLTNTYGPRVRIKDARQLFLGIWIKSILSGEQFEVWGGEQIRDLTFVDDVVEAILLAAQCDCADGEIYNLGGPNSVSLRELAEILIAVNGSGSYVLKEYPSERKKIDIGDFRADSKKIQTSLGWAPRVPLEEGFERTLTYYRRNLTKYA